MADLGRDLRRGELNIEGLGKRYWFRSDAGEFDTTNVLGEADPDSDGEQDVFAFFRGQRREIWALRDITCHVEPGERVAIVGANGAGKSTLIRILSNLLPPSEGKAEGAGVVLPFAALRSPLSPHDSGCDNLRMLARLLGIPLDRLEERLPQIIDFSELGSLAHERVTRYSDQSFGRLAMAMGLLIDADIYLVDDSVKVGDELYRNKFQQKFAELLTKPVTLIFASNALEQLRSYCRRALWLDRGKLVADGEVNAIISRFLSKDEEAIDFKELTAPDAPGDAAENREITVPSDGRDRKTTKPSPEELAEKTGKPMPVAPIIVPAHRLQPMTHWLALVTRAENSWQRVLTRWREKTGHQEQHPIRSVDRSQPCTLAVIRSLCPMSMQGKPIRTALPGEALLVELLIETFQPNVTVAVRLELDAPPTIIFAAEPLVPLPASDPGQYLFRAEIDGDLMAYSFEAAAYKLRTRILLTKADADLKEMMIATIHLKLRGDLRYAFDDWRVTHGEPVTSIVNPAGAFIGARENIEDADAMNARSSMTTWEKLNRRPLLRPRLKWMIYRVSPEPLADGASRQIQPGLEPVSQ